MTDLPLQATVEESGVREQTATQLAKQLQESQALYEISQMLAGTIDQTATLQHIANAACDLIKSAKRTILHLVDDSGRYLQPVALAGSEAPQTEQRMNFALGEGIAGIALQKGDTINVHDVLTDSRYIAVKTGLESELTAKPFLRSLLVAPVKTSEKILGTLSVQSETPGVFTPDDERLLTTLGVQAALAIEKAKLYSELEESLRQEKAARARLVQSEKLAALGRIVASVAHELNNPLQAMQNALYLVQLEEDLSQQAREDLKTVLSEVNRMADLIARLREIYRPTASEEFQDESVDMLVEEVHKLLSTHLRHNRVNFEFHPDDDLPLIPIIRDQIKQVILNISLNAIEAMQEGGELRIRTWRHPQKGGVVLTISDTGPSISSKILPYIFDPFMTTKEGGTGLGLAISYDIIQRHHGTIDVQSESGYGTTFTVWLPGEQRFSERDGMRSGDEMWFGHIRGGL